MFFLSLTLWILISFLDTVGKRTVGEGLSKVYTQRSGMFYFSEKMVGSEGSAGV